MNTATSIFLKTCRRMYRIISPVSACDNSLKVDRSGQAASDLIKDRLSAEDPCMICRFGSGELSATLQHLAIDKDVSNFGIKAIKYIQGKSGAFWWEDHTIRGMRIGAGLFPVNEQTLTYFGERMLSDIQNIDILGSWLPEEIELAHLFPTAQVVTLTDLEPYYHANPWSEVLKDKVVLVINPFEESIRSQYEKRDTLFKDPRVLPKFQLKTLKAVQSIAGNTPAGFSSWFAALDSMCDRIQDIEFDIAIVGAGAYGLPLASFVKSIGKKAVHLGGATQILFGIRGKRWDDKPFFQHLFNENWIKPLPSETPSNFQNVESGCYW
jgi:hypothetical protein